MYPDSFRGRNQNVTHTNRARQLSLSLRLATNATNLEIIRRSCGDGLERSREIMQPGDGGSNKSSTATKAVYCWSDIDELRDEV
jgi:hypothetical protein